ncbi:MAG: type IX secretion system membrane protein PorP/SprF [Calditrichaeota bacterium]|nr:MAG: type IX secretion system membrane protein PorP/SprF [Calditrichota bacterium]
MKYKSVIFIYLISALAWAQNPASSAGSAGVLFLRSPLSARTAGLGEAFTAVANDENALYYNPAGLANIRYGAFGVNHTQWFEDIKMDNLTFGYNFDRKLGMAIAISHMWMPELMGKDAFGNETQAFNVSSSVVQLGLGYRIHPSLFLGVGLKYFQDNLADITATGIAIDAGFYMYTMIPGLSVGLSVQNFGSDVKYENQLEKLPLQFRAGLAYKIRGIPWRIAVDAYKSLDSDVQFNAGMEYTILNTFSLRIGNQFRNGTTFQPGYGVGLNINNRYRMDYTYLNLNDLGATHRIGFTFQFGLPGVKVRKPVVYKNYRIRRSEAPRGLHYEIKADRLLIKWKVVRGAVYNIYARVGKTGVWKKLNSRLINGTEYSFKRPKHLKEDLYISITSVINSVESPFSEELRIEKP